MTFGYTNQIILFEYELFINVNNITMYKKYYINIYYQIILGGLKTNCFGSLEDIKLP
jgi:hypothetical protein